MSIMAIGLLVKAVADILRESHPNSPSYNLISDLLDEAGSELIKSLIGGQDVLTTVHHLRKIKKMDNEEVVVDGNS